MITAALALTLAVYFVVVIILNLRIDKQRKVIKLYDDTTLALVHAHRVGSILYTPAMSKIYRDYLVAFAAGKEL